ncbi:MAG: hypothetical protein ACOX5R_22765 [bacterium]
MQFPIKWAMDYVLEDPFGDDADQIVIITSSLASYMVMDTITQLNPAEEKTALTSMNCSAKLDSVIMLANQMPLLLLSEVTQIGDHLAILLTFSSRTETSGMGTSAAGFPIRWSGTWWI